jgi:hypothetical protein
MLQEACADEELITRMGKKKQAAQFLVTPGGFTLDVVRRKDRLRRPGA